MQSSFWRRRLTPQKLHTRTTILTTGVLAAVFAIIVYFSDLAVTKLSDQQERQQAQLLATRVADTVEHHIKRQKIRNERRKGREKIEEESESTTIPDWAEVEEEIEDTIAKSNPQLREVRVFSKAGPNVWKEAIRMGADTEPLSSGEQHEITDQTGGPRVVAVRQQGQTKLINARAAINVVDAAGPTPFGIVTVLLTFDESQSSAAALRRLIWPLMLLAIVAITLMTYFLFRHLVYKPIDNLLLGMSKAEEGDLAAEVAPTAPDEIGLLTSRFNRMLGRIRQMTEQLNLDQRRLEERVSEATGEIAERKEQLEDANLRLFEMQRQLTQLERLAAAGQLAAQFAHEVGTPLNLISGHVQLLRARTGDERMIKRLDVIAGQIERITEIVRSMLDSTRRPRPELEAVNLNDLLAQILDATQPTLVARNVKLQTRMSEGLPSIPADPDQLQQVFINLINNSLDAMPEGGMLRVATARNNGVVVVELSDNGQGIAEEQIELIFDPMFSTKQGRGTGLGLTIVKQIISEHNGDVTVESAPGKETTFRISLPLLAADEPSKATNEPSAGAKTGGQTPVVAGGSIVVER
ncbi:MAG TPA: ATP-binding protein [Blastocatellia bacterium]|nr:ATP-binding protein [Blastocatellia bacterium]